MRCLKLLLLAAWICALPLTAAPALKKPTPPPPGPTVKRVIVFVADGLGTSQLTLLRLLNSEAPAMDGLTHWGLAQPGSTDSAAPDSAAACTALATGQWTRNNLVSMDAQQRPLLTIVEAARRNNLLTGLIGNLTVTHASIGGFAAHVVARENELGIAEQYLTSEVTVLMGGGLRYFQTADQGGRRTDGRNLIEEFRSRGYRIALTATELQNLRGPGRVLAPVQSGVMPYRLDRSSGEGEPPPGLADFLRAALQAVGDEKAPGFLLVLNAGRLDWAAHDQDAAATYREMVDLDEAVAVALSYARSRKDTLVVVVGSHGTGGLSITPTFKPEVLRSARGSLERVAKMIKADRSKALNILETLLSWTELTTPEKEAVVLNSDPSRKATGSEADPLVVALAKIQASRSGVAWATDDHTAELMPVAAFGPGADRFAGRYAMTEVPRRLARLMHLTLP